VNSNFPDGKNQICDLLSSLGRELLEFRVIGLRDQAMVGDPIQQFDRFRNSPDGVFPFHAFDPDSFWVELALIAINRIFADTEYELDSLTR
jgi:hypothetical protein